MSDMVLACKQLVAPPSPCRLCLCFFVCRVIVAIVSGTIIDNLGNLRGESLSIAVLAPTRSTHRLTQRDVPKEACRSKLVVDRNLVFSYDQ